MTSASVIDEPHPDAAGACGTRPTAPRRGPRRRPLDHVARVEAAEPVVDARRAIGVASCELLCVARSSTSARSAPSASSVSLSSATLALATLQPQLHAHHGVVGLELRERQVEHAVRLRARVATHEVGGHVVGGAERRAQHERTARREIGHLLEGDERRPQHDGVAERVDAAASGASGELRVLPRREELVVSPVNLVSFSMTTVRAGMLMPSASVSVANTTFTRPSVNRCSTVSLNGGTMPA